MQVFQKELGKRTGTVQVLKRSGRELIENSRDDTTWVKVQLQELSNRWDTVCKLSVSKQTRLEQALKQVRRKPWLETLLGSFAGLWVFSARSSGKRFCPGQAGPTNPAAVPVKQWGGISQLLILFPKKKNLIKTGLKREDGKISLMCTAVIRQARLVFASVQRGSIGAEKKIPTQKVKGS